MPARKGFCAEFFMKVIIMCGGKGTRLREETAVKPKPMVEIGGRPILWHIMHIYSRFGYNDFILPLGYKGEVIKQYFADYHRRNTNFTVSLKTGDITTDTGEIEDWRVTLCDTGAETLKGGRLKRVARYIDTDRFMVTYGDGVADIDIDALVRFHKESGCIGTFTGVRMPCRFGAVRTDETGKITSWEENERIHQLRLLRLQEGVPRLFERGRVLRSRKGTPAAPGKRGTAFHVSPSRPVAVYGYLERQPAFERAVGQRQGLLESGEIACFTMCTGESASL